MERRSSSRPLRRRAGRWLLFAILLLAGLLLLSFALPIRAWRTGEQPAPPLPLVRGGPAVDLPRRVWIDTDAACGLGRTTDPDDCLAILLLARAPGVSIVGISTVHGNAPLALTDSVTRALIAAIGSPDRAPAVYRGASTPLRENGSGGPAPAHGALRRALADGPLTLVALGPLTNLALALAGDAGLRGNVGRIVAVMGRRPGHLFHPAEGAGGGILFGHGPVFRDFNVAQDPEAAARVLALGLPMTLVPYEAAREVTLDSASLARIRRMGRDAAWVVDRSRGWLDYWRREVGRAGFYPFDLVGAAYALEPGLFHCAATRARVARDEKLWPWMRGPNALLVGPPAAAAGKPDAEGGVIYCPGLDRGLHRWLLEGLEAGSAPRE